MTKQKTISPIEDMGNILVTGGAGFVGQNFAQVLLDQGYSVRVLDLAPCTLEHPRLEKLQGDICDKELVLKSCEGIDTVFHTAAIIEIRSSKVVPPDVKKRAYDINLGGTKNIVEACQEKGVRRLVYTSSNSVVFYGQAIRDGDESMPYADKFRDLYTETKTQAEQYVLANNDKKGLLTCAIRPSGIWGPGDQTMFKHLIQELINGTFKAVVGDGSKKLDNSYVYNLIHGHILAAKHLVEGGSSPGQAYFINDNDPVNMMYFSRPVVEALGYKFPSLHIPYGLVKAILEIWQFLHLAIKFKEPPQSPLALERVGVDNFTVLIKRAAILVMNHCLALSRRCRNVFLITRSCTISYWRVKNAK